MRDASSQFRSTLAIGATAAWLALAGAPVASAQDAIDPDAASVLASMQTYLGGLQSFSAQYDVDVDVITQESEKLKFSSSGELLIQRPDKLYVTRKGFIADAEVFLDGQNLTIYGKKLNGYIQFPAATIDAAIDALRDDTGFDAPGADLLTAKPLDAEVTDFVTGTHVGMTYVGGAEAHHLAFRGKQIDWQLWVQAGDQPLPLKYVITSKWQTGAPEYSLRLSNWNVSPTVDAARFTFTPSADATKLALLPAPPPAGSAAFALDEEIAKESIALHGTPRWTQATVDADLSFPNAAGIFSCALRAPITQEHTPRLYLLLRRTLTDVGLSTYAAKNHYQRTRPFVVNNGAICTPAEQAEIAKDGSYPSGHTAIGWAWALILSEISPEQTNAVLARGEAYGDSRNVCNVHWHSDVVQGRMMGAAVVARLHAEPEFRSDLEAARSELAAARSQDAKPTIDCAADAAALAE